MLLARHHLRLLTPLVAFAAMAIALQGPAHADRAPLLGTEAPGSIPTQVESETGLIVTVDPDSVSCDQVTTFGDVAGGDPPGANYDGVLWSGGMLFGERFLGQTIGYAGDYDVVTGTPGNPLTPVEGAAGQNLTVFTYLSNVLSGLGPLGYAETDAIGEGSIAMYFAAPQQSVAFDLVGGNGGSATLTFYRADGSLIDEVVVSGLGEFRYGFATGDLTNSIAGILIQNTDPSGVGIDNVCHEGTVTAARASSWGGLKTRYR